MSPPTLRFVLGHRPHALPDVAPDRTLLDVLREDLRCTAVKEGCASGDCGACTVAVAEAEEGGRLHWRAINSCIRLAHSVEGMAVFTAEDIAGEGGRLHPAQRAMLECHGSQCGFCTPGFVMSLFALHRQRDGAAVSRDEALHALSGNLCRCTGYRPILDAGERMFQAPAPQLGDAGTADALRTLAADPPLHCAGPAPVHAPRSLADLATLRAAKPQATLLAGSTDIGLWVNKQFRDLGEVIYLGAVPELQAIGVANGLKGGVLSIGAGASLQAAWAALAAHWPAARDMGRRFASRPVREAGTMGGNVANGSPIGDSAPVLIALGASVVLRHGSALRTLPLQDFYLGYMKNQLQPGEFVEAIRVPLPGPGEVLRVEKLSKRFDCDISGLSAGLWLRLDGSTVIDARFAFGGMAAIVQRAAGAEAAVRGQPWTAATVQAAMAALDADFRPLSDLRASAGYRQRAARALLQRLWLATRPDAPLADNQLSVWGAA